MFSFLTSRDWIHQTFLLKFLLSWYYFIFTINHDSILPNEILTNILLRLPTKSLLKCMSISKSWHRLISSPHFVNTHLKLNGNHRVVFPGSEKYKFCSPPHLFNKEQLTQELLHIDPPTLSSLFVGSANGHIFLCNHEREMCIWNPTISKSMKLLNSTWGTSFNTKYGFGYDDSRDDYKAIFIDHYHDFNNGKGYNVRIVVNIYSLTNDSWKTLHDYLQGIFLINHSCKFVNGMIYWIAFTGIDDDDAHNIISFDVSNETWGSLEIPICGEDNCNIKLGVVGSDLVVLYTCHIRSTTSDVWILKDYRGNMSWMKRLTIEYPKCVVLYMFSSPNFTFSMHLRQSNKGDIILSIQGLIMLFDGSTKKLEHIAAVGGYNPAETYAESIVNPRTKSDKNSA